MSEKFYAGSIIAIVVLVLILVVAPYLRLRQREAKRRRLESWYEIGPKLPDTPNGVGADFSCGFCGGRVLKKDQIGAIERADLLRRFNHRSVDESRFYEYRCAKCSSLAFKEKQLIAPSENS